MSALEDQRIAYSRKRTGRESLLRGTMSIPSKPELLVVRGGVDGRAPIMSPMGFEPNPNEASVTVAAVRHDSGC